MSDKNVKIRNPQKRTLLLWIVVDLLFIFVGLNSYVNFDMNSFDGLFILVSIVALIVSIVFIPITIRNMRWIDDAINKSKRIAYWEYDEKEWKEYLLHEKKYRLTEGKMLAVVLYVITAVIFIPFILIIKEAKLAMFIVMLALFLLYTFMGFVFPRISFFKVKKLSRVILLEKGILINNQFHTWAFPLSSFNSAEHKKKPYDHLAITYDFVDRTWNRRYTVNVPIPKKCTDDIKKIISSFK